MHLFAVLFVATLTSAIAGPEPAHGVPNKRAEATSGPISFEALPSNTSTVVSTAAVTDAPAANPVRVDEAESDYESSSSCMPASICFDGITCGLRYGGCFDKNFCAGSTSFPMPTTTCDPATGLTQKRAEAAAAKAVGE